MMTISDLDRCLTWTAIPSARLESFIYASWLKRRRPGKREPAGFYKSPQAYTDKETMRRCVCVLSIYLVL